MTNEAIRRLREICRTLPEAVEGTTVHHPSLKIRNKTIVMVAGDDTPTLWIKSPPGVQQELVASDRERFFVPPYVGPKGWVGVRLDAATDWDEIAELVTDGYRMLAPKRLVRLLDEPTTG